jgi:hypothetical protein
MAYQLEGRMLDACSCNVICPCWVGEDPDGGKCAGAIAWHVDKGAIDGVDVSGLTVALAYDIPGNALKGNWRAAVFVDDKASPAQEQALVAVFSGKKGGPVADLAQLIGEVVGVQRAPITFDLVQGKGSMRIGSLVSVDMEPLRSATGASTALSDAALSVTAGAPYYVGKASTLRQVVPGLAQDFRLEGDSAVQGPFRFEA